MDLNVKKVQKIMLDKGISPKELAEKANMDKSTLSRILNSEEPKPRYKTIHSLAKGLGVEPLEIVKEE